MNEKRKDYQKAYQATYRQRAKRVGVLLSNEEYQRFKRTAGNKKVTSYIKELALAGLDQQAAIPEHLADELSTIRFAIRNIANNVNQMARHSHTVRNMTSADENNLLQHLKQLEDAVSIYTEGRIMGDGAEGNDSGAGGSSATDN